MRSPEPTYVGRIAAAIDDAGVPRFDATGRALGLPLRITMLARERDSLAATQNTPDVVGIGAAVTTFHKLAKELIDWRQDRGDFADFSDAELESRTDELAGEFQQAWDDAHAAMLRREGA